MLAGYQAKRSTAKMAVRNKMGWLPRFVLPRKWCSALRSRNNLSFNDKFRTVTSALEN
jgi:hypothetical protein